MLIRLPKLIKTFCCKAFFVKLKYMIPKEQAAQLIVDSIALMIINVAAITETETNYKKQELLEAVIKRLKEIV